MDAVAQEIVELMVRGMVSARDAERVGLLVGASDGTLVIYLRPRDVFATVSWIFQMDPNAVVEVNGLRIEGLVRWIDVLEGRYGSASAVPGVQPLRRPARPE